MANQMKSIRAYRKYQVTRRATQAQKFVEQQQVYGAGSDVDGGQAIIDLAVDFKYRLNPDLVAALEAAGYDVPAEVK